MPAHAFTDNKKRHMRELHKIAAGAHPPLHGTQGAISAFNTFTM
jgi:hypothetical protein